MTRAGEIWLLFRERHKRFRQPFQDIYKVRQKRVDLAKYEADLHQILSIGTLQLTPLNAMSGTSYEIFAMRMTSVF